MGLSYPSSIWFLKFVLRSFEKSFWLFSSHHVWHLSHIYPLPPLNPLFSLVSVFLMSSSSFCCYLLISAFPSTLALLYSIPINVASLHCIYSILVSLCGILSRPTPLHIISNNLAPLYNISEQFHPLVRQSQALWASYSIVPNVAELRGSLCWRSFQYSLPCHSCFMVSSFIFYYC